ncbi:MAG: hypothetical protein M3453_18375 [Pseudomonadota bacterium]|nr:hypothetical protein [Pseudomonadota bacterium]
MSIEQDHHWHVNGAYAGLALLEPGDKRLYDGAYANSILDAAAASASMARVSSMTARWAGPLGHRVQNTRNGEGTRRYWIEADGLELLPGCPLQIERV